MLDRGLLMGVILRASIVGDGPKNLSVRVPRDAEPALSVAPLAREGSHVQSEAPQHDSYRPEDRRWQQRVYEVCF